MSAATTRGWGIALVRLSDSFQATLAGMAEELGASCREWSPASGEPLPNDTALTLVLAGGEESAGLELLTSLPTAAAPHYLIGAVADHRLGAAAVREGARDYFALPEDLDLLRRSLEREAREARGRHAAAEYAAGEREATGFGAMVGRSAALRQTLDQAARVAQHRDVTVLIGGETGTGKELLARAIHYHSPRAAEPFVEINCAAIPANLLESELFGHEKGAFTGATATKPGLFELAHGGTLFLDEVGNLPLELQPKLLRALESRSIRRVGGQQSRSVDVRVIAATHVNLPAAVQRGEFREDLYYRLNVIQLVLPPLRRREGDVELLAETFAARLARGYGLPVPALGPEVRAALRAYRWPGNVRELRNAVERALVLSPPGELLLAELGGQVAGGPAGSLGGAADAEEADGPDARERAAGSGTIPFPADLDTIVRSAAQAMLALTNGNKSEAARRLGISRPRLLRILNGDPGSGDAD
jgi:DNA-binding NtrC family response regulator